MTLNEISELQNVSARSLSDKKAVIASHPSTDELEADYLSELVFELSEHENDLWRALMECDADEGYWALQARCIEDKSLSSKHDFEALVHVRERFVSDVKKLSPVRFTFAGKSSKSAARALPSTTRFMSDDRVPNWAQCSAQLH
jgi:hypothetical protein